MLLAPRALKLWIEYLSRNGEAIAAVADEFGWPTDRQRVLAVAGAQYKCARPSSPAWDGIGGVAALGRQGQVEALNLLKAF